MTGAAGEPGTAGQAGKPGLDGVPGKVREYPEYRIGVPVTVRGYREYRIDRSKQGGIEWAPPNSSAYPRSHRSDEPPRWIGS